MRAAMVVTGSNAEGVLVVIVADELLIIGRRQCELCNAVRVRQAPLNIVIWYIIGNDFAKSRIATEEQAGRIRQ